MNCIKCGKTIQDASVFCNFCGKKQSAAPKKRATKTRGNGMGCAYRRPGQTTWTVEVVAGWRYPDDDITKPKRPVRKTKGGFKTKKEALDYVWDKCREDRTQRKVVFLDELWTLIGAKSSVQAAEFVMEIFKVIRGYGGAAVAATQDLNDFFALEDGKYGKAIISNAKTKLVLNLEPEEAARVAETLGLTSTEEQQITRFERGEALLAANTNHVTLKVRASESENALITTDRSQLAAIIAARKEILGQESE